MTQDRAERGQDRLTVYIFRLEKTEHYARIANSVFEDSRLSWEARGYWVPAASLTTGKCILI
jgi:hypothetical protein